jgi:hypothetical protein
MAETDTTAPDDAAASEEWAKMLDAEDQPADAKEGDKQQGEEPARVLNQDEIDTLLGFDVKKTMAKAIPTAFLPFSTNPPLPMKSCQCLRWCLTAWFASFQHHCVTLRRKTWMSALNPWSVSALTIT